MITAMSKGYEAIKRCYRHAREEFIIEYGGKCSCCGETDPDFLTLDHVYGGGNSSRKTKSGKIVRKSWEGYTWLRKQGWPKDEYRILCWNCNCGRAKPGNFGVCPHEKKRLIEAGRWPPPEIQRKMIQAKGDFGQQLLDLMLS
jgi:hypothetical protein